MCFALLLSETMPSCLIKLGQVGFILGVDYMDGAASSNHDIRNQVPKGPVTWIGPVEGKHGLSKSANFDLASGHRHLAADNCLDVGFPQLIKWQLPGESIEFAPASESALVHNPSNRLQTAPYHIFNKTAAT